MIERGGLKRKKRVIGVGARKIRKEKSEDKEKMLFIQFVFPIQANE